MVIKTGDDAPVMVNRCRSSTQLVARCGRHRSWKLRPVRTSCDELRQQAFSLVRANPASFGIIIIMGRSHRAALLRVTIAALAAAELVCCVLFPAH
jgi:hypothetical protein